MAVCSMLSNGVSHIKRGNSVTICLQPLGLTHFSFPTRFFSSGNFYKLPKLQLPMNQCRGPQKAGNSFKIFVLIALCLVFATALVITFSKFRFQALVENQVERETQALCCSARCPFIVQQGINAQGQEYFARFQDRDCVLECGNTYLVERNLSTKQIRAIHSSTEYKYLEDTVYQPLMHCIFAAARNFTFNYDDCIAKFCSSA